MQPMNNLRNLIKKTFKKVGLEVIKQERMPKTTDCELLIATLALRIPMPQVTLVQIGANDGISRDPVHELVEKKQVKAILVEPNPRVFEVLKTAYTHRDGLQFSNCAVSERDGFATLYAPRTEIGLGSAIGSFNKAHVEVWVKDPSEIEAFRVPTKTMQTLLREHSMGTPNVLAVDTEGYDWIILREAFNQGIVPDIIFFENNHLSRVEKYESRARLALEGYQFFEGIVNTTAVHGRVLYGA